MKNLNHFSVKPDHKPQLPKGPIKQKQAGEYCVKASLHSKCKFERKCLIRGTMTAFRARWLWVNTENFFHFLVVT